MSAPLPMLRRLLLALACAGLAACTNDAICLNCGLDAGSTRNDADVAAADGGSTPGNDADISTCIPTGEDEACNDLDDDCDGRVDEDFDLANDPSHCGRCNHSCTGENLDALCVEGACETLGCQLGFVDLDGRTGCEYRCPVYPPRTEDCNGVDDDCDTRVDEDLVVPAPKICRSRAGTPCAGVALVCDTRANVTTWYCDYGAGVQFDPIIPNGIVAEETLCDGIDNDCDALIDEPWPEIGMACDDGKLGACRDDGIIKCRTDDLTRSYCDLSVLPDAIPGAGPSVVETCNGIDDDCDGTVDNAALNDPTRVLDAMVHVQHSSLDFWIYTYEASRPDADASEQGAQTARACSKPSAQPWTYVSYAAADAACAAAGRRLCTADEWQAACESAADLAYPYGATYDADSCNGADYGDLPVASGAISSCISSDGAYDLSGNVREWTTETRGDTGAPDNTPIYVTRGGSYLSPAQGLTCQVTSSQASANSLLPTLGFRCCSSAGP